MVTDRRMRADAFVSLQDAWESGATVLLEAEAVDVRGAGLPRQVRHAAEPQPAAQPVRAGRIEQRALGCDLPVRELEAPVSEAGADTWLAVFDEYRHDRSVYGNPPDRGEEGVPDRVLEPASAGRKAAERSKRTGGAGGRRCELLYAQGRDRSRRSLAHPVQPSSRALRPAREIGPAKPGFPADTI
jgi:hypothetical protein